MKTVPFPGYENAVRVLELDAVFEQVKQHAMSESGALRISELPLLSDPAALSCELQRVTEMRDLLNYDDPFPLHPFSNIQPQLKKIQVQGAFLSGAELFAIRDLLALARKVRRFLDSRQEKYPLLCRVAEPMVVLESIERNIEHSLEPTGEVKDAASPALSRIRKDLARQRGVLRSRLEHLLRSMVKSGYAQEESLVLRQGRLVIPMKDECQSRLKGIVVDQSASGATVFVEPLEALELGNGLRRLELQELQEIERILRSLTALVSGQSEAVATNLEQLAELDSVAARAKYSLSVKGNAATSSGDGNLELRQARHPLLLLKHKPEEVVPLSVQLDGELRTVVVTGPNAGGKTVALKTVGLLALMHQHGLHVPADDGTRFPMFSSVFADIGDQQSIEQDLSTFSSHIQNLRVILTQADSKSLVLLDEIGSATDPAEGGALAMGILKTLTQRRALTLATTHIGLLKIFAHDEPGVENGSMVFDQETLKPTYRFQMGVPGSSYAFEIAEKCGLPQTVLVQAKTFLGEDRNRLDKLIFDLEDRLRSAEALHREAVLKESRFAGLARLYESRIQALESEAEERKQSLLAEAEALLGDVGAMKEKVLKDLRETRGDRDTARRVHQEIQSQKEKIRSLRSLRKQAPESVEIREGDRVAWRGHGGTGRVVSPPDKNGKVLVEWNDVRVRIAARELEVRPHGAESHDSPARSGMVLLDVDRLSSNEIDLRGKTADEALALLDRYLADAVAAGFSDARIIHGKGTGVLRKEIQKYLENHPLVKSRRFGAWNEGDVGVTIVEFR